jgi:hypothetical protein
MRHIATSKCTMPGDCPAGPPDSFGWPKPMFWRPVSTNSFGGWQYNLRNGLCINADAKVCGDRPLSLEISQHRQHSAVVGGG